MPMNIVSIKLDRTSTTPMYIQVAHNIESSIKSGTLNVGDKLPPIRRLASDLAVNNVTIVNAYKQLEINGYVNAIKGSGYYVAEQDILYKQYTTAAPEKTPIDTEDNTTFPHSTEYTNDFKLMASGQIKITSNTINFASATPDPSIFPFEAFKSALNEVLDRDKGYAFGYQESNGYEPLRESLCDYFLRESNIIATPGSIQIVSGAQQGIDIIGKAILKPGDYVITENPTYTGATAVFKSRGANIIGVPIENDGINTKILEANIKLYKPKLIYVMTQFQNPTTISYSKEKRKELLVLADKYNLYIVEDDSLSGLSYDNSSKSCTLKSLDTKNRVIYIKSFSKLLMPGLRIGFLISPKPLMAELLAAKHTTDISSSGLIQRALHLYFKNGHWEEHLNYMREIYKVKFEVMVEELTKLKIYGVNFFNPSGGLNFWVTLPKGVLASELYTECSKNDILIVPCNVFYVNKEKNMDNAIRISYAATNVEEIRQGMRLIKDCLVTLINTPKKTSYIGSLI
ncbi:MAG: PLP-dependent aminotransferase family protein [Clostridium sp.]|uniref:MocR-like pyridoxine biosynthesis transcription factor PdxR n=1 Tax=Clostridium sp. TaxID=1506 RepID=UPI003054AD31